MTPSFSVLFSVYNRVPLFRRALWALAQRPPSVPFEVVVADDGSTEDIEGALREFSSAFLWKLVRWDVEAFAKETGVRKYWNSPAVTNNVALRHSLGGFVALQGAEVIAWGDAYDRLLADCRKEEGNSIVFSTTFNLPDQYLATLDRFGTNLSPAAVRICQRWVLQSELYPSLVTNYLSVCKRSLWEEVGGYDERFLGGIAAEDSDFVRRAVVQPKPGAAKVFSQAVSLHQDHGGSLPWRPATSIDPARFREGVRLNRLVYDAWDGTPDNKQSWPWGELGVKDVVSNW